MAPIAGPFVRRSKTYILVIFVAFLGLLAPALAEDALFDNWAVTCESDGYCRAETPDIRSADHHHPDNILRIARRKNSTAAWEISIKTLAKQPPLLSPAIFRIAGQRSFALAPNREITLAQKPNEFFLTAASSNQALFRRLIESRHVFVTLARRTEEEVKASFSLNGLSAALLWIDEKQARIGSRRTVKQPESQNTPTQRQTSQDTAEKAILRAYQLHAQSFSPDECNLSKTDAEVIGIDVAKLDSTTSLVQIPCFMAAYNISFALYRIDETANTAALLHWALLSQERGWVSQKTLSNVSFDSKTKTLSMVHKARGIADCGIDGEWQWVDGAFNMVEMRAKPHCDGIDDAWPLVFP